jgi:uncharacterized protein
MRSTRRTVLVAALVLAAAALAGVAQPHLARTASPAPGRTITVTGNGTATATPDRASFQFGVTTQADTAKAALARNAATASAVIAALKSSGVAAADLQTTGVWLSPQTSPDGTQIVGYTASNSVSAQAPLAGADAIVDTAVGAGANTVSGPSLDTSDQAALYASALKLALGDAKAKAETIASAAGLTLGAVQTVTEGGAATPLPFAMKTDASAGAAVPIEPGTQEIDATVTVTYSAG